MLAGNIPAKRKRWGCRLYGRSGGQYNFGVPMGCHYHGDVICCDVSDEHHQSALYEKKS
jgi:hypothetical protein